MIDCIISFLNYFPDDGSSITAETSNFFFFFFFFSRATDQQYGIKTFEDNSKLHAYGHTNEHVQFKGAHQKINRSLLPCRHTDNDIYTSA